MSEVGDPTVPSDLNVRRNPMKMMEPGEMYVGHESTPLPARLTDEQRRILKHTAGGGELSDDEFVMYLTVAARTGLDPLMKQIVATKFHDNRTKRKEMVLIVAITGMRTVSQRAGIDNGMGPIEYTADGLNWTGVWLDKDNPPAAARCSVYRKGVEHPFTATVTWDEFCKVDRDTKKPTGFWRDMPSHMLGKCAEAMARRMAFSDKLSGIFAPEEFGATDPSKVVDAGKVETPASRAISRQPAQPRLNDPGVGSASSKPDDGWLAPVNYHLLNTQPKGEGEIDQDRMGEMFNEGRRTKQFVELYARHMTIEPNGCAHLTPAVTAAAEKLGLATPA